MSNAKSFYVYIHKRATDGSVFYVGKGAGRRAWTSQSRNKHWKNTRAKHGINVEVLAHWPTELEAFEHEKFLIKCFKDMGCNLVNMTDGGEGVSGLLHSEQTIQKIKNKLAEPEIREKCSLSRIGKLKTEDHKQKLSIALAGKPKTESALKSLASAMAKPEIKAKVSAGLKAAMAKPEVIKKISDACKEASKRPEVKKRRSDWQIGRELTSNTKDAISQGVKKALSDPATREKLSLAVKAAWQKRRMKNELAGLGNQASLTTSNPYRLV